MKQIVKSNYSLLLVLVVILTTSLFSCKSSFPPAGTLVECNGQFLEPILNPTQRAEFIGGKVAMFEFIKSNFNFQANQKDNIKDKVRLAFIVTKEGDICDVRVVSKPQSLDSEIVRVVRSMPKWNPGINNGQICDSYFLLDLKFN
ncbi:hypothetical protein M2138_000656 [Dysgonomonadaceae bacterium PH5-43]|nr:hypothetical protein [Dysgonomonadaceae bacterium PH5-43]